MVRVPKGYTLDRAHALGTVHWFWNHVYLLAVLELLDCECLGLVAISFQTNADPDDKDAYLMFAASVSLDPTWEANTAVC